MDSCLHLVEALTLLESQFSGNDRRPFINFLDYVVDHDASFLDLALLKSFIGSFNSIDSIEF